METSTSDRPPNEAATGLQLLQVSWAVTLGLSFLRAAGRAYLMMQRQSRSYGSAAPLRVLFNVDDVAQLMMELLLLFGLYRLVRGLPQRRPFPNLALGAFATVAAAGLVFMGLGLWGSPSAWSLGWVQALITVSIVCDLAGFLFVDVLLNRVSGDREPGWARPVYYTTFALRTALSVGLSFDLFARVAQLLHESPWGNFALRQSIAIVFFGVLILRCRTAEEVLRDVPAAAPSELAAKSDLAATAYRQMMYGGLWLIGGLALTILSYQNATLGGGRYVVAYGAVIGGAAQLLRGLFLLGKSRG